MNRHSAAGLIVGFACGVILVLLLGWGSRYQVVTNDIDHTSIKVDRLFGNTWILVHPQHPDNSYWRQLN